jgi:acylphosphatase
MSDPTGTPASPRAACTVVVRGRVQGVGFRQFVAFHARRLRLAGWVRNTADGMRVEVYAEGERQALEELARQMQRGPSTARVDGVEIAWSEPQGLAGDFQVRW